ncbi:MAG: flagellar biosynthetic protein FliR [Planctomycetes bacterium]|nr:flagellar biosynthetic protein FliR [Planctomycetota bacterium]MCB9872007.1 flagellar biosynthetic protein FliR [Planctomycetota bacterium]MCB9888411.1 flagellar biosynthetic protein FliR [Planctomycetota bacterium]
MYDLLPWIPSLLLHVVRAGAFFIALQVFGTQGESRMLRLVLSVSLASILWWVDDDKLLRELVEGQRGIDLIRAGGWLTLGVLVAVDAMVGFAAGFAAGMISHAMSTAGEVISHDMGFAMAEVMDPITGRSSAVMSQLFQTIVILLVLSYDLHHGFIRILARSSQLVPVGHGFDIGPVFGRLNSLIALSIDAALRYAFPLMGVMVLLTAVLVVLARAIPNINLMEFSFGLRILVAIFAAVFFLAEGMPFLASFANSVIGSGMRLFEGAF